MKIINKENQAWKIMRIALIIIPVIIIAGIVLMNFLEPDINGQLMDRYNELLPTIKNYDIQSTSEYIKNLDSTMYYVGNWCAPFSCDGCWELNWDTDSCKYCWHECGYRVDLNCVEQNKCSGCWELNWDTGWCYECLQKCSN